MKKYLLLLLVLISCNCFGISQELEESLIFKGYFNRSNTRIFRSNGLTEDNCLIEEDTRLNHEITNLSIRRFIIIVDRLAGNKDPFQKENLKIALAIEASLVEDLLKRHIEDRKQCNEFFLTDLNEDLDQLNEKLRLVRQITNELTRD